MSIHVALNHVTHYRYDRLVNLGPQIVRLRPAPHCRTRILSYSLRVEPAEHFLNWQQDPQSQLPGPAGLPGARRASFRVEVDLVAEMTVINPFDFFLEPAAEQFPVRVRPRAGARAGALSAQARELTPRFAKYLGAHLARDRRRPSTSWSS